MSPLILTPDRRIRVFVSSTLRELAPERNAARDAIATLRLTPVLFELGARPHPPQALYRSYLEQSDVFIGIYSESYGWVAPGADVSGIEDEYRLSEAKPRLVYVKEPAPQREPRLDAFLAALEDAGGVSYKTFETTVQLGELISQDLALLVTERFHLAQHAEQRARAPSLPARSTSFVGREAELAKIEKLFDAGARLVTLTGPGGIGKTSLAVEAAEKLRGRFSDGVAFVPLDGLESPDLVESAVVAALGIGDVLSDPVARLQEYLCERSLLLLLDNFEHVLAAAPLVTTLLEGAAGITVLATSRELLRLRAEHEVRVPPLPVETEATTLFAERASAAASAFELREEDRPLATEICRCLDGVPLAIELAAPRLRLLTAEQLLDELRERLALAGPRDAPARQQTLQAAIAWSYDLLNEEERGVFERLGVFHGSFTIEGAEAVAGPSGGTPLLDLLSSLLDKSIVYRLPDQGETRFAMLRMIRDYALERLVDAGGLEQTTERFTAYYLRLALQSEDGCRSTAQRQWIRTLDFEADNFRAALASAADRESGPDVSVLMRGLWLWFWVHGNLVEGRDWAARGLECATGGGPRDRGWLLAISGSFAVIEGEFELGFGQLAEAGPLMDNADDRRGLATVRLALAYGGAPLNGEEWAQAELADALATFEDLDDLWGVGTTLHAMCRLRTVYDRYDGAGDLFERALHAVERVGDDLGIALALVNLAYARLAAGDLDSAEAVIARLLGHMHFAGITYAGDDPFEILARIEHAQGDHERAVELVAAAERLRLQHRTPLWPTAAARHDRFVQELRATVGSELFEAACARGRTLDLVDLQESVSRLAGTPTTS